MSDATPPAPEEPTPMIFAALLSAETRTGHPVHGTMVVHALHAAEARERALECWKSARPDLREHGVRLAKGGVHHHLRGGGLRGVIPQTDGTGWRG